ncbi:putative dehydrogenase [Lewinella aquimaris]|uniref:Putative dehydrogenase n=1 Tax=Neolewinella aquimaris TaxID=1835722 RepID=A0A840E6F7_9BACT|nr:Gfo/Idh/MocA family oxidoreductase [Neolewinella aquimaris]MBB4080761.1 putative dehydrogenase [Neolewinella aquimaris]
MKRRTFIQSSTALAAAALLPGCAVRLPAGKQRLRTAHIGLGYQGAEDMKAIASHASVDVVAICDVDTKFLAAAQAKHPDARAFADYRVMLREMGDDIDAVVVATPDHTHAPASLLAMNMDKPVYCQKPLTHHVSEAREMDRVARERKLVTQMGIQVHSFYDYRLATQLIQSGIIGKVHTVRAWSPKNWGYDAPEPTTSDPVPPTLDWNLWQGTAPQRDYVEGRYHPSNWRQILDYGCGTLGDMGVHIFDTPYNALELDVPLTIVNECRPPTGYGFPENNVVTYEFPGTPHTAERLKWVWYDGPGAPADHPDLELPNGDELPDQGAVFIGENGRLLLPHFMQEPRLIVDGAYQNIDTEVASAAETLQLGTPIRNYETESPKHYHQFVDACLGRGQTSAPFSYAARLTEVILLGVIAGRFPGQTLHWNAETARFAENDANQYLEGDYREF